MPRPSECTPAVTAAICKALESGGYRSSAAAAAHVSVSTLNSWCQKGRQGIEPYATFLAEVKAAEQRGEQALVDTIKAASFENWTAAAWLLERRRPEQWSKKERVAADIKVTAVRELPEEEQRRLLEAAMKKAAKLLPGGDG